MEEEEIAFDMPETTKEEMDKLLSELPLALEIFLSSCRSVSDCDCGPTKEELKQRKEQEKILKEKIREAKYLELY